MSTTPENPPYIHVVNLLGVYHINKMEWDNRADDYQVTKSIQCVSHITAKDVAKTWAEKDGIEIR